AAIRNLKNEQAAAQPGMGLHANTIALISAKAKEMKGTFAEAQSALKDTVDKMEDLNKVGDRQGLVKQAQNFRDIAERAGMATLAAERYAIAQKMAHDAGDKQTANQVMVENAKLFADIQASQERIAAAKARPAQLGQGVQFNSAEAKARISEVVNRGLGGL